jgi:hypothetical protein
VNTLIWIFLFLILFYYAMKLFLRYVLPWLLGRYVRKQQEKYGMPKDPEMKKEGDVRIRKDPSAKKNDDGDFGEYVDFEEIEE